MAPITASDIAAVERLPITPLSVPRRMEVLARGARPDFVYMLLSGWAARYEIRRNGGRRITGFLLPGDFCGIHAICEASMDHAIIAVTDCTVGTIPREAMSETARGSKAIFDAIWRAKLIEEAILRKWLVYASDAHQSVGRLLCELHARVEAVGLAHDGRCAIPLTQEEIGDALGITAVHVNRTIQRLRSEGLIEMRGGELTILDGAELRRVAEFETSYLQPWLR